ncbi:MAG: nucleotidyltransferase domain-containing protein [Campylobacterota bacterium]|nr:nucleotidyltransferase domain-containing protein [Campylobacterota bacterium]
MNTTIINKLKELKPILKERYGIEEFAVFQGKFASQPLFATFGSVAKGTDTQNSDVDIAVLKLNLKDAFALFYAKDYLSEQLKRPVDIGTFRSMKTFIKNRIKKDFIYV